MKRHEATIFDFTGDDDDKLLVTSHEGIGIESVSIHYTEGGYSGFTMCITKGQMKDLMAKLQEAIITLEVYQRRQVREA